MFCTVFCTVSDWYIAADYFLGYYFLGGYFLGNYFIGDYFIILNRLRKVYSGIQNLAESELYFVGLF